MRVNIYAEEMTDRVEIVTKEIPGEGKFTGVRFYLYLPATWPVSPDRKLTEESGEYQGPFIHREGDDDSAAVTFWGKAQLKIALKKALELLESHESQTESRNADGGAAGSDPGGGC